jgi:DNA-directed RNA polymerase specialized sigma24 family protein
VDLALDLAVILAELPDELRDLAHRLQRQTLTEIAREANLPLTTVQRRRERLRDRLAHVCGTFFRNPA